MRWGRPQLVEVGLGAEPGQPHRRLARLERQYRAGLRGRPHARCRRHAHISWPRGDTVERIAGRRRGCQAPARPVCAVEGDAHGQAARVGVGPAAPGLCRAHRLPGRPRRLWRPRTHDGLPVAHDLARGVGTGAVRRLLTAPRPTPCHVRVSAQGAGNRPP
jgi:hypothetical protein